MAVIGSQPTVTKVAELPKSRGTAESSRSASRVENPALAESDFGSRLVSIIAGLKQDAALVAPGRNVAERITMASPGSHVPQMVALGGALFPITHSGSFAIISGQTLSLGDSPVTIKGQNIKLVSDSLEIASSTTARFPVARSKPKPADQMLVPTKSTPIRIGFCIPAQPGNGNDHTTAGTNSDFRRP